MKPRSIIWAATLFVFLLTAGACIEAQVKKPGWKTPVTTENTGLSSEALRLPDAPDSLEGLTFEQIITDPEIAVRPDGESCAACHDWPASETAASFCKKIEAFVETDQDGDGPKPQILKDFFEDWVQRGCPE